MYLASNGVKRGGEKKVFKQSDKTCSAAVKPTPHTHTDVKLLIGEEAGKFCQRPQRQRQRAKMECELKFFLTV